MAARVVTVVQARVGSSRLPGKILRPLLGATVLERQLERMRAAQRAGAIVVAIPEGGRDDVLVEVCRCAQVECFRGDEDDLLDRHLGAARRYAADIVVKIPSDCPLIDPAVIDRVIAFATDDGADFDYVSNLHPATYPDGNDVEVMTRQALETAWREASRPLEREHTTPFLWERPERFRLANVACATGFDRSMTHRFTLDYEEDFAFVEAVYQELYEPNRVFGLAEILDLLQREPVIAAFNAHHAGVNWYRHHLDQLHTIDASMTRVESTATTGE